MKMKKYTADTMVEAMKKVRADFGDEAVILSSSVIKSKGFMGFFQKKSVEVVAGYDEPVAFPQEPARYNKPQQNFAGSEANSEIKKEMKEMRKLLQDMKQSSAYINLPESLTPLLSSLEQQELSEELIFKIGNELYTRMKDEKKDFNLEEQNEYARKILLDEFSALPFGGISFNRKYVNVLGPTGVGKTTTIAKIAARALLEDKKKVGFITTDTYRIAAIEQLRTYANLLQAPVEVVYNKEDFNEAIAKMKDIDVVFIDTAGRNYKESKYVDDIKNLIDFELDMESYLVLSVTSKEEDMKTIVDRFTSFPIGKFIFTKVDETHSVGPIFNLMKQYGKGVAYYTDGQEVPEDISEATLKKLIDLLLAGVNHA